MDNKAKIKIKEAFDQISEIYDRVRRQPWKDLIDFMKNYDFFDNCNIILDIGCGNGRHTKLMASKCSLSIGLELSYELLKIAKLKYNALNIFYLNSDALNLPFRDNIFSKIIYIAALHHISGENQRIQSLLELKRVLKSKGQAIITVWRRFQQNFLPIFLIDLFLMTFLNNKKEFGDIIVPWRGPDKTVIANRFYHLFTLSETKRIIKKAELKIIECKYFSGKTKEENIIALIEKN
ncbi:MAG: class I SAM-dependent methyltransferase [Candidatus Helarchaeota archaeon]